MWSYNHIPGFSLNYDVEVIRRNPFGVLIYVDVITTQYNISISKKGLLCFCTKDKPNSFFHDYNLPKSQYPYIELLSTLPETFQYSLYTTTSPVDILWMILHRQIIIGLEPKTLVNTGIKFFIAFVTNNVFYKQH